MKARLLFVAFLTLGCKARPTEADQAALKGQDGVASPAAQVSTFGVDPALVERMKKGTPPLLPPGAAVLASAGNLTVSGNAVTGILQAAGGQAGSPDASLHPTAQSVAQSLTNALLLARNKARMPNCVAVAFLMGGGGITFVEGLTQNPRAAAVNGLARGLWNAAVDATRDPQALDVLFMPYAPEEIAAFKAIAPKGCQQGGRRVCWKSGGILEGHQCPLVVISSHLDAQFADHGLSLFVAKATGDAEGINAEVRQAIAAWAAEP